MSKNRFPTQPVSQPLVSEVKAEDSSTVAVAAEDIAVPALPQFDVTYADKTDRIAARDSDEAWAMFCDKNKVYPSPKSNQRKVVPV